jgi:hypothetical protein
MAITLEITANSGLEVTSKTTELTIETAAVPAITQASQIYFAGYGNVTADNIEEAIQQLADNSFSQSSVPNTNLNEGDTWYNTATETFNVYRETSVGVFEWVPILVGSAGGDSDTLDAGAF